MLSKDHKKLLNIWATLVKECVTKNFQKSPNPVTLIMAIYLRTSVQNRFQSTYLGGNWLLMWTLIFRGNRKHQGVHGR